MFLVSVGNNGKCFENDLIQVNHVTCQAVVFLGKANIRSIEPFLNPDPVSFAVGSVYSVRKGRHHSFRWRLDPVDRFCRHKSCMLSLRVLAKLFLPCRVVYSSSHSPRKQITKAASIDYPGDACERILFSNSRAPTQIKPMHTPPAFPWKLAYQLGENIPPSSSIGSDAVT